MKGKVSKGIRWLLATMVIMAIVGIGTWAYVALTSTGDITVEEPLSFVGDSTFSVTLYPQMSDTVVITVANASSVDMDVDLLSTIDPDPGPKGMTVDIPAKITVPGSGEIDVNITIIAGKSAEPGSYTVSIEFDR